MTKLLKYEPDYATPPGETLRDLLGDLGMSQVELAERTGLSPKHINQVMQGAAPLTPDTASRLEPVVGVPAKFWNSLEASFQSRLNSQRTQQAAESDLAWLGRRTMNVYVAQDWNDSVVGVYMDFYDGVAALGGLKTGESSVWGMCEEGWVLEFELQRDGNSER